MKGPNDLRPRRDRIFLFMLFAVFLLASPAVSWWAADDSPWYLLYLLWLLLIIVGALLFRHRDRHEL